MQNNETESYKNDTPSNGNLYQSITEELVRDGLQNDKGKNVELLSWEVKNFTNKGDGYTSLVTSITIKYKKDQNFSTVSYVVKLNPQRPPSLLTDIMKAVFPREKIIFTDVIGAMSKHLERLGLVPIKTPRIFASSMEKGKEAFVAENLRTQGFQLHDKRKGLDFNHSFLVMVELGRFHASSLLLQESIAPKTFVETFEYFEEHFFQANCKYYKIVFDKMLTSQALGAVRYLSSIPKYEKCSKWLNDNQHNLSRYFSEGNEPKQPFTVLVHGDCWTNNLLFKYNSEKIPVDLRLVDLQASRLATPAADINYFFYTSLTGNTRYKYSHELLDAYYQSFSNVLSISGKEVPFTFKELEDDVERRKIVGLVIGLIAIPGIFFEGDDEIFDFGEMTEENMKEVVEKNTKNFEKLSERGGPFKERLLSMFDEMMESNIFDEI